MHSVQKQFQDFIETNHLIEKDEKVLLAVSGGMDSMVMANLFLQSKIDFQIAHCNFGLRGAESDGDEAFVMQWADTHDVNCYVKQVELSGESIQLEARNIRYQWFNELQLEHGLDKIATAHHVNDSLETTIYNLSRGTGVKGMQGIPIRNQSIIRPLLFATKETLHQYALDEHIDWREDSSNQRSDYDRNFIRHEIIPQLKKLNPSVENTFQLTSERLRYASDIVSRRVSEVKTEFLSSEEDGWKLDLSWVEHAEGKLLLAELLAEFGCNYVTSKQVFAAIGNSGKTFEVGSLRLTMDRSDLYIESSQEHTDQSLLIDLPGIYYSNSKEIIVEKVNAKQVEFDSESVGFFDASALAFPFSIRPWVAGDRINPLGMQGEKKVSDLLIDEKVPLNKKKGVLILQSQNQIAWVIGFRISEQFKVKPQSKEVIKVSVSHPN